MKRSLNGLFSLILVSTVSLSISGCLTMSPAERMASYNATDTIIVDEYFSVDRNEGLTKLRKKFIEKGWSREKLSTDRLILEYEINDAWGNVAYNFVLRSLQSFKTNPFNDEVVNSYLSAVRKRTGTVRLYSKELNNLVFKAIGCDFCSSTADKKGISFPDGVLIEYDENGRMISALLRATYFKWNSGYVPNVYKGPATADANYYSVVLYKSSMGLLENTISKVNFDNTYIRDFLISSKQAKVGGEISERNSIR